MKIKFIKSILVPASGILTVGVVSPILASSCGEQTPIILPEEVKLSQNKLELFEGETYQLTAKVLPENVTNKEVTWKSNNENIATVENGLVKAVSKGTATITVISQQDSSKTAKCEVKVKELTPAQSVQIVSSKTELIVGDADNDTIKLEAKVSPENATNKEVTWSSNNDSVAKVDQDGLVTAVSEGKATITVRTKDGNHEATCDVVASLPLTLSLNKDKVDLFLNYSSIEPDTKDFKTEQLTATVLPENAVNKKVTWSSSDNSIATVDENGKITAVSDGTATITATVHLYDWKSYSTKCQVNVINFELNELQLDINKDESKTLTLKSNFDFSSQLLVWSQDNMRIALVDQNGKVTGKEKGTTSVTVTMEYKISDSETIKLKAKCQVNVN